MGININSAITPATGVGGTTGQAFQHDGILRTTQTSDVKPGQTDATDHYFDSLSRNAEEQEQPAGDVAAFVTNNAFTSVPATQVTYPNNRTLNGNFDALYRKQQIIEAATGAVIAAWQYFGTGRVAEVALGNGVTQTMLNNARTHSAVQGTVPNPAWGTPSSDRLGYDGAGRFIGKRYLPGGINGTTFAYNNTNPLVGNTAGYDPASNKNFERALHAENTSNLYQPFDMTGEPGGGYDSINRLLQYQRGTLAATGGYLGDGGGSVSTPIGINNTNVSRDWNLDGLGNWRSVQTLPANSCSAIADIRSHNKLNEITQRNAYELPVPFSYDGAPGASNGNLINDGTLIYKFDALNRLVQVSRVSDGAVIATYVYDAMNRRVRKAITNGGLTGNIPDSTTDYFYSGWQVIEERNAANNIPLRQYVWGNYIDDCIQLTTFAALGAQALSPGTYYLLQDLLYRAVALTNSAGAIVEAYDTDAYGNTIIFTAPDPSGNWWSNGATQSDFGANEIIFCGYRYDPETRLYYVRNRTYNPALGRWIQRDPIWYGDGANLYAYAGGHVVAATDPAGQEEIHPRIQGPFPRPPSGVRRLIGIGGAVWTGWKLGMLAASVLNRILYESSKSEKKHRLGPVDCPIGSMLYLRETIYVREWVHSDVKVYILHAIPHSMTQNIDFRNDLYEIFACTCACHHHLALVYHHTDQWKKTERHKDWHWFSSDVIYTDTYYIRRVRKWRAF